MTGAGDSRGSELGTIADYVLLERLERANNGEFYVARAPKRLGLDDEFVMIKVLDTGTPEETFRRATRELRAFAAVDSPYLVALHDAGQEGHRLFYSMEYLPLGSLANPQVALDRARTLSAVAGAARAAHALHDSGIAHRDIQPVNVLLTENGGKLADLGLAQVFSPDYTVTGFGNIGAVDYMDPDVLTGAEPSRASDIWSLGATLHRSIAGIGVFGDLSPNEPLKAIKALLSTDPVISTRIDAAVRDVIEKCLRLDGSVGFATADEVADALDRCLISN